jgi:hypothetical protein
VGFSGGDNVIIGLVLLHASPERQRRPHARSPLSGVSAQIFSNGVLKYGQ